MNKKNKNKSKKTYKLSQIGYNVIKYTNEIKGKMAIYEGILEDLEDMHRYIYSRKRMLRDDNINCDNLSKKQYDEIVNDFKSYTCNLEESDFKRLF